MCEVWNYIEPFLILVSVVTGSMSISTFASLLGIPIGITSSAIEVKICTLTSGIKKHKPIIKKKKNKYGKIALRAKSKLNSTQDLISKVLTISNITHDKLVSINNVLKKV